MDTRSSMGSSKKIKSKVNKRGFTESISVDKQKQACEKEKYQMILGTKKPVVILKDCLNDKTLLNNSRLILWMKNNKEESKHKKNVVGKHVVKKSRIADESRENFKIKKSRYDKRDRPRKKIKRTEVAPVKNANTVQMISNNLEVYVSVCKLGEDEDRVTPFKDECTQIAKNESDTNSGSGETKQIKVIKDKALKDVPKLKTSPRNSTKRKVLLYTKNSNAISKGNGEFKSLTENESIENLQGKVDNINVASNAKEINSNCFLSNRVENLTKKEDRGKTIVHSIQNLTSKGTNVQEENSKLESEANKDFDTRTGPEKPKEFVAVENLSNLEVDASRDVSILTAQSEDYNLYSNDDSVIKSYDESIAFSSSEITPKIMEIQINKIEKDIKNVDFSNQKRKNDDQNANNNNVVKKVKLSRNHWLKYSKIESRIVNKADSVINSGTSSSVIEESNTVAKIKAEAITRDACTELENEKDALNSSEQNQSATVASNEGNCNFLQQTQLSKLVKEVDEPSTSSTKPANILDVLNSTNEGTMDDEDSDCISLFADSALIEEYDVEKSFYMVDDVFDNYYKNTKAEFNKIYTNAVVCNDKNDIPKGCTKLQKEREVTRREEVEVQLFGNARISETKNIAVSSRDNDVVVLAVFRGYCYNLLRTGDCKRTWCRYSHEFLLTLMRWYDQDQYYFFKVLDKLRSDNYTKFIRCFYMLLLRHCSSYGITCVLKIFKKLFDLGIEVTAEAYYTLDVLLKSGHSLKSIGETLATIVSDLDFRLVNLMSKVFKNYVTNGEFWNTLRNLLIQMESFEPEIVEVILRECVATQKYVLDVDMNIMRKVCNQTRSKINNDVLLSFEKLIKRKRQDLMLETRENVPPRVITEIRSPDPSPEFTTQSDVVDDYTRIITTRETAWKGYEKSDDNNNIDTKDSYKLHTIDDLPEPRSVYGRSKFWKFYVDVYSLREGLKHNDYDHVIRILNSVKESEQSFFTRACYEILCNEIRYSHYRLSKLVSHSVQTGTTKISFEILLDVAKCVLQHLAEKNFWILAYGLLKDVYILFKARLQSFKTDAVTIMLFAEIYLANDRPIKAYNLLKQTKLIYMNRSKWKVRSTLKDINIRIQIITILLYALCTTRADYAFSLFQFLVLDQYNNFHPIDLTSIANKMIPKFLLNKDHELIVSFAKLIIKYTFMLNGVTYRALIARLVNCDMTLAKKLYRMAIGLGIYSTLQFYPTMHLVVNADWTKEEMYLSMLNLMEQLSLNIGHAIDGANPKDCTIYLSFENTRLRRYYNCSQQLNELYDKKIKEGQMLLKNVLQEQFNPPLSITKNDSEMIYKLDGLNVITQLRSKLHG